MLHVYYTQLPESVCLDENSIPLSGYRREKLRRTVSPLLRRQMLAAELLLNRAAGELVPDLCLPLEIRTGERGKPDFAELPYFFSLSLSGPFVACAIADYEIGVDIQERSSLHETLVKRCFSEEEQRYVYGSSDRDAAFTEIWCLKESYIKATGEGLAQPFSGFSLRLGEPLTLVGSDSVRFWRYRGDALFCLAVCALDGHEAAPDTLKKSEPG